MSVTVKTLLESKAIELAQTTQITSVGVRTIIDKFTAYNSDATVARTITVNKIPPAGAAATANIIVVKTLQPKETYTFPEVVGHTLEPGASIGTSADLAAVINLTASGRVVS